MVNNVDLTIHLRTKYKHQPEQLICLTPSEYFEPLEDWETCFDCDSTPRHDRLSEYLGEGEDNLEYAEVAIDNAHKATRHVRREVFWINNWMSVATDYEDASEASTEVIMEIRETHSGLTQLIKFDKQRNDVRVVMHLLLRTSPSGEIESESIL